MLTTSGVSGYYSFVPFHSGIASGVSKRHWAALCVDAYVHMCMQTYACIHVHVCIAGEESSHQFLFFGMLKLEWVLDVVSCLYHKWNMWFFPLASSHDESY